MENTPPPTQVPQSRHDSNDMQVDTAKCHPELFYKTLDPAAKVFQVMSSTKTLITLHLTENPGREYPF